MVQSAGSISHAVRLVQALADELLADPGSVAALASMRRRLLDPRGDDDNADADTLRDLCAPGPKGIMEVALLLAADVLVLHPGAGDLPPIDLSQGGA